MKFSRVVRCGILAGVFAALCVVTSVIGAIITLAVGVSSLVVVSHRDQSESPEFSEFLPWLLCTISFAAMTLVLAPMAYLPAVWIALCILAPLFGTMIHAVERAYTIMLSDNAERSPPSESIES